MDYTIALSHLKQSDPILASLIDQIGDCTLDQAQQSGDVLFSLSRSIISQQLSTKAAKAIHTRFLALYSGLPTAEAIINTADEDLRSVGLSRSKTLYIKDLAQQILNGLPTITELATLEDEAIVEQLTQIKGIGRWTVQMLLIFRLHRWDVLPIDDLGIRSGIRRAYNLAELPNAKAIAQLGQPWQPYRTIASWYLWRSLELNG
jgi:DNA-3-methyladenine glycosylase II